MRISEMRPTFDVALPLPAEDAIDQMHKQLREEFRGCTQAAGRCVDLYVPEAERHFWSPHLSVQVEEAETGSRLHGRFGPHPEVWTLFVFLYAIVGVLVLVGAGLGYSQWLLGRALWGFLLIPAAGLLAVALYVASRLGQKLGRAQMSDLRTRLEWLIAGME